MVRPRKPIERSKIMSNESKKRFTVRVVVDGDGDLALQVTLLNLDVPEVDVIKIKDVAPENLNYSRFAHAVDINAHPSISAALKTPFLYDDEKKKKQEEECYRLKFEKLIKSMKISTKVDVQLSLQALWEEITLTGRMDKAVSGMYFERALSMYILLKHTIGEEEAKRFAVPDIFVVELCAKELLAKKKKIDPIDLKELYMEKCPDVPVGSWCFVYFAKS